MRAVCRACIFGASESGKRAYFWRFFGALCFEEFLILAKISCWAKPALPANFRAAKSLIASGELGVEYNLVIAWRIHVSTGNA